MKLRDLEDWLLTHQAAKKSGRSRQGVLDMAKDGRVRAVEVGRNHEGRGTWIYDPADVQRLSNGRGER